jgi:GntR family transcriptional regulator, transcriptional repressor for pyruvate dehydrogenase complex
MTPRTYQVVLRRIEADLAAGRIDIGERLPGERVLAERYGVSRSSVREAIRVLEAMGLIRTAVGSGPDAGAVVIADPAAPIGSALRWHLASRHLPVGDLVGARVLIESWAVAQAAQASPTAEALAPLDDLLAQMDRPELAAADFLDLDTRFHVAMADLAGNGVVAAIMAAMREGVRSYVTAAVDGYPEWPAMAVRLRAEHSGILAAVRAGSARQASDLVTAHIQGFYSATGVG